MVGINGILIPLRDVDIFWWWQKVLLQHPRSCLNTSYKQWLCPVAIVMMLFVMGMWYRCSGEENLKSSSAEAKFVYFCLPFCRLTIIPLHHFSSSTVYVFKWWPWPPHTSFPGITWDVTKAGTKGRLVNSAAPDLPDEMWRCIPGHELMMIPSLKAARQTILFIAFIQFRTNRSILFIIQWDFSRKFKVSMYFHVGWKNRNKTKM